MATAFGMTHALPNVMDTLMRRQGEQMTPHVVAGGLHATAAGMVSQPMLTQAYLPGGGYVNQEPAAIDYTARGVAATGTAWVCLHASRSATIAGWSRQPGTHYLVAPGPDKPVLPANALWLMQVHTAASALTTVCDRRHRSGLLQPRVVSVLDYGAVEGGVIDCTDAFNAATHAFEPWHDDLRCTILIPPGLWKIDGTVYVRNGQTLTGMGTGATKITTTYYEADGTTPLPGSMFVVGSGYVGGAETPDVTSGGIPPEVCHFHCDPGRNGGVMRTTTAGWFLHDLFFTNAGTGFILGGYDGMMTNVFVDQSLQGIVLENCGNLSLTNLCLYLCNYGLFIHSNVHNVHLSNSTIEYGRYAHLVLGAAATQVNGVHLTNVSFITNEQFATLVAQVAVQSGPGCEVWFHDCEFRNPKGYAVSWMSDFGTRLFFTNCLFDGQRDNPAYTQSSTAGGIQVGTMTVTLRDCTFRDLVQAALLVSGPGAAAYECHVTWDGGMVSHSLATYVPVFLDNTNALSTVVLRDIDATGLTLYNAQDAVEVVASRLRHWVGPRVVGGGRQYWQIPYRTGDVFQVTIGARTQGGGSDYRKTVTALIDVSNGWDGTQSIHTIAHTVLHRSFPGDLTVPNVDLQVVLAGGVTGIVGHPGSGYFAVSLPATDTNVTLTVDQVGAW